MVKRKCPVEIGDKVVTEIWLDKKAVVRTVIDVGPSKQCQSGWLVKADGGEVCKCCGFAPSKPTDYLDSSWFEKVEQP